MHPFAVFCIQQGRKRRRERKEEEGGREGHREDEKKRDFPTSNESRRRHGNT